MGKKRRRQRDGSLRHYALCGTDLDDALLAMGVAPPESAYKNRLGILALRAEHATDAEPVRMGQVGLGILVLAARDGGLPTEDKPHFSGYVDLVFVFVREEARNKGVAAGLVTAAKKLVRKGRGLYAWRPACKVGAARKLWASCGLTLDGADGHPEPEEGSTGSKMPAKAVAASLTWHAPSDEWDCVQPVHGLHAWTNSGGSRCSNPACQIRRPGLPIFW